MKQNRGYFGIGIYHSKNKDNIGTLWRSAYLLGASYIFTIGKRYQKQASDTIKTIKHIPLFHYESWEEFKKAQPIRSNIVLIEQGGKPLKDFNHPKRAVYVLGAEDHGIPKEYFKGHEIVEIESTGINSFNVATSGSIVMYDRFVK